jgi:hypothetical protein
LRGARNCKHAERATPFHLLWSDACRFPLLKSTELFAPCSSVFTAQMAVLMQEVSLASGETVFRAREAGTHLYIIGNGSVDIVSYGSDGVEKVCLP